MKLSEALEYFIELENKSAVLYEKTAETSSKELEIIFLKFRDQELEHAQKLSEYRIDIIDIDLGVRVELLFMEGSGYGVKNYTEEGLKFTSRKDFFIFALQGEKNSILTYTEFKEFLQKDSNEFKMIETFIEEERNHMYYILKMMHDLK